MPDGQLIEFDHVTKRFGAVAAVSDLSARVNPGVVTGFLGPNGAGKTTTLRMLLGLERPTIGTTKIGGKRFSELRSPARVIGAMLEDPGFRARRTVERHLTAAAKANGIALSRVGELISFVGLGEDAETRIAALSLGMRQRLSAATALIGDPGVLVLDEPANGLDPEGIRWMRTLIRGLADEGRTVLVSSHVLSEVEQIADEILVIAHGELKFAGTMEDLADPSNGPVVVDAADRSALSSALRGAGLDFELLRSGLTVRGSDAATIGGVTATAGVALTTLQQRGPTLEDVFLDLVNDRYVRPAERDAAPAVPVADEHVADEPVTDEPVADEHVADEHVAESETDTAADVAVLAEGVLAEAAPAEAEPEVPSAEAAVAEKAIDAEQAESDGDADAAAAPDDTDTDLSIFEHAEFDVAEAADDTELVSATDSDEVVSAETTSADEEPAPAEEPVPAEESASQSDDQHDAEERPLPGIADLAAVASLFAPRAPAGDDADARDDEHSADLDATRVIDSVPGAGDYGLQRLFAPLTKDEPAESDESDSPAHEEQDDSPQNDAEEHNGVAEHESPVEREAADHGTPEDSADEDAADEDIADEDRAEQDDSEHDDSDIADVAGDDDAAGAEASDTADDTENAADSETPADAQNDSESSDRDVENSEESTEQADDSGDDNADDSDSDVDDSTDDSDSDESAPEDANAEDAHAETSDAEESDSEQQH